MYLIVDGYNIIGAWKELATLASHDLGAARNKLYATLRDYCGYKGYRLLLVFDAHLSATRHAPRAQMEEIVYTGKGETADNYIERFVRENYRVRMIVASSDSLVQVMIFSHASRMSARELEQEVQALLLQTRQARQREQAFRKNALEEHLSADVFAALDKWRKK